MKKAKKLIAAALTMAIALSCFATNAFAAEKIKSDDVKKVLQTVTTQLENENFKNGATLSNSHELSLMMRAGTAQQKHVDEYLADVKNQLDANGGKLMYGSVESAEYYAETMYIIDKAGKDFRNFEGYNLEKALNDMDKSSVATSLYINGYTAFALNALGEKIDADEVKKVLVEAVKGAFTDDGNGNAGYDYWGISVDNASKASLAIGGVYDTDGEAKAQFDKAAEWVAKQRLTGEEEYGTKDGYSYNAGMDPTASATSTAHAINVFAVAGDMEKAADAFRCLLGFDNGDGTYGEGSTLFTAKEILEAGVVYYEALKEAEENENDTTAPSETTKPTETTEASTGETSNNETSSESKAETTTGENVPSTGSSSSVTAASVLFIASLSCAAIIVLKKRKTSF